MKNLFYVGLVAGFGALALPSCRAESLVVGVNPEDTGQVGAAGAGDGSPGGSDAHPTSSTLSWYLNQVRNAGNSLPVYKCLPMPVSTAEDGSLDVRLFEASVPSGECSCPAPGRAVANATERAAAETYLRNTGYCTGDACAEFCVCTLAMATGSAREACLSGASTPGDAAGWCYLSPPPDMPYPCAPNERWALGVLNPAPIGIVVVIAAQAAETEVTTPPQHLALGKPCLPEGERDPDFSGYGITEVVVNTNSPACGSGVCLVDHMEGRVSCPYGQSEEDLASEPTCFVPGSDEPIAVYVASQREKRQAPSLATCSCRCAGPGDGPFCACPSGTRCTALISETGIASADAVAGSYCIVSGTEYRPEEAGTVAPRTCAEARDETANAAVCGDPRPY